MNTICFGQQPCGFFPKRFLVAKINTARKLQKEIGPSTSLRTGARIVFFYHDSDADYRETITIFHDRQTNTEVRLNFTQENKIQKKYSPLYLKRIPDGWKEEILKQLPRFVDQPLIDLFNSIEAKTVADFCLEMYQKMGLLDGIEIVRSSDKNFRQQAEDISGEYFADIPYQNEIVRAKILPHQSALNSASIRGSIHEGGGKYIEIPVPEKIEKWQKNPGKDQRFAWMNSVIHSTHYIAGNSEYEYIKREQFPEVTFIKREEIKDSEMAWLNKF